MFAIGLSPSVWYMVMVMVMVMGMVMVMVMRMVMVMVVRDLANELDIFTFNIGNNHDALLGEEM